MLSKFPNYPIEALALGREMGPHKARGEGTVLIWIQSVKDWSTLPDMNGSSGRMGDQKGSSHFAGTQKLSNQANLQIC